MKKIAISEIKRRLEQMYPDQCFDFSNYVNTTTPMKVIDPIYGEWFPTAKNLLSKKRKHPRKAAIENSTARIIPLEAIIEKISFIHNGLVSINKETYKDTQTKCEFIDSEFGSFYSTPNHVLQGHGHKNRGIKKYSEKQVLPLAEVLARLKIVHRDTIVLVPETYKGMYKNAIFIHTEFGIWEATPNNVIMKKSSHPLNTKKKTVETYLRNYGVAHPMQNEKIYKNAATSRWDTVCTYHWKTNEKLICRGSYEYAVVSHLNKEKIDFAWQIRHLLPGNIVYFADLYLKEMDKYIEIKGYFYSEKNKNKWELFHSLFKNSEIWFYKEVLDFTKKSIREIRKDFKEAKGHL